MIIVYQKGDPFPRLKLAFKRLKGTESDFSEWSYHRKNKASQAWRSRGSSINLESMFPIATDFMSFKEPMTLSRTAKKLFYALFMSLLVSLSSAACPFCLPTGSDMLTVALDSNVVARVKKIDDKHYKIVEVLKGSFAVGRIVIGGEDPLAVKKKGRPYKILSTTTNPNRPFWTEPVRNLTESEYNFLKRSLQAKSEAVRNRLAAKNLEHSSPEIAESAYNLLAPLSVKQVQKLARLVKTEHLVKWIRNPKVPRERRSLYLFMVMPRLEKKDLVWLNKELFQKGRPATVSYLPALMVAYSRVGGAKTISEMETHFLISATTPTMSSEAISGFSYIGTFSADPATKVAARELFRRELSHPERGVFAITYLGEWRDFSVAKAIEQKAYENPSTPWVISSVTRYFRSFDKPEARRALARLKKRFPELVNLKMSPFKRL